MVASQNITRIAHSSHTGTSFDYSGSFSGLQSTTPTQRTYSQTNNSGNCSYSSEGTHTLSDDRTTAFIAERTWELTGSENESPEFEIDPTQNPPTGNGYYTILFRPISANVSGIGEAGNDVTGDDTIPGKVVLINDGDADNDGIPDYADGYNLRPEIEADEAVPGA